MSRALAAVNKARRRQGQDALTRSPIYRYTKGMTHKRAAKEKRGRKKILTGKDVNKLLATGAREAGPASSLQMTDHLHVVAGVSTLSLGGGGS